MNCRFIVDLLQVKDKSLAQFPHNLSKRRFSFFKNIQSINFLISLGFQKPSKHPLSLRTHVLIHERTPAISKSRVCGSESYARQAPPKNLVIHINGSQSQKPQGPHTRRIEVRPPNLRLPRRNPKMHPPLSRNYTLLLSSLVKR